MTVTVVCGGVGAARFLRALAAVHPADRTVGVVNTGDDTVLHGLAISPDLDTITYTLAEATRRVASGDALSLVAEIPFSARRKTLGRLLGGGEEANGQPGHSSSIGTL